MEPLEAPIGPRADGPSPFKRPALGRPPMAPRATSMGASAPAVRLVTSVPPAPPAIPASPAPTAAAAPASTEHQQLEAQSRRGAFWFYWIAGLSLVNSALAFAGQDWRFIIGLGMSQIVDTLAARAGRGWTAALLFDALLMGGFVLLGTFAVRGHAWAFLVGVSLYGLDGLISVLAHDWLGLGFHVFVLIMILKGFQAARHLAARAP
jgi:hypothetical protein